MKILGLHEHNSKDSELQKLLENLWSQNWQYTNNCDSNNGMLM